MRSYEHLLSLCRECAIQGSWTWASFFPTAPINSPLPARNNCQLCDLIRRQARGPT